MDKTKLLLGDSLETLKTLDANSIDAMVLERTVNERQTTIK
jgi:hypothetical protein